MNALVLEGKNRLSLRDIELSGYMGSSDVRIDVKTVGICGSDIHYYLHGAIGPFVSTLVYLIRSYWQRAQK